MLRLMLRQDNEFGLEVDLRFVCGPFSCNSEGALPETHGPCLILGEL